MGADTLAHYLLIFEGAMAIESVMWAGRLCSQEGRDWILINVGQEIS
jgi:hypothetical protein